MTALRNRLVTEQDGAQHVSSVVLSLDEAAEFLDAEADMHKAAGWQVDHYGGMIRCSRGTLVRWLWIRSRSPLEDTL